MNEVLNYIYRAPLYWVFVIIILSISLWCVMEKLLSARNYYIWKIVNSIILVIDLIIIVNITIIARNVGTSEVYLTPFYSYIEAQSNVEMYRTNLMNVFLFLPFGLSLPVILPASFKKKVLFTVLAAAGISVSVELIQFVFELGRVETDDVIHNTLGAALGAWPVVVNRMRVKN